jgi:predicted Rossmann fold flavoprotein
MLFTHRGISGPAVLQLSNYWQAGESIIIDLLPDYTHDELRDLLKETKQNKPNSLLRTALCGLLPNALAQVLLDQWWPELAELSMQGISNEQIEQVCSDLQEWSLKPSGTEGYRTAEVTKGGVDTKHLSSKTMQVTDQPGLYFIGEVVDVVGHLGGFNFQWAWSSGYVAGMNA